VNTEPLASPRRMALTTGALFLAILLAPVVTQSNPVHRPPTPLVREAYFGDFSLYTTYSFSAYLDGVRTTPDDAYRFARGESVAFKGENVTRSSPPLDFLAVTDQAENLGLLNTLDDSGSAFAKSEIGQKILANDPQVFDTIMNWMLMERSNPYLGVDPKVAKAAGNAAWAKTIEAANRHYRPGKFTTFIGYHWTAYVHGANQHRNILFRSSNAPAPFTAIDSIKPEDLWTYLEGARSRGQDCIAIPHDAHLSHGARFDWVDSNGERIDRPYAERRALNEPLVEIASLGQSETHPALSPEDAGARFELFGMEKMKNAAGSYIRDGLGRGLVIGKDVGVNPYRFGFVGSTHYETGLSDTTESIYNGARGTTASNSPLKEGSVWAALISGSGSLTGVWAEQNTRESIFSALLRREVYATSGTRLKVRLFGGWKYDDPLLKRKDWVASAYTNGVPMGSNLPARPAGTKPPSFVAWATKDPNGANLDRLQVIRVRLEAGKSVESIFDVALTNTTGAPELLVRWQDPDFNPDAAAVYYLRALEIPTPRWSTVRAAKRGEPAPADMPATIQERAWSSPIWFTP